MRTSLSSAVRPVVATAGLVALVASGLAAADRQAPVRTVSARHAAAPATFRHPGVLVGKAQLDVVRDRVNAGAQPWTDAYAGMNASSYASLSRTAKPREVVECGPSSNPNLGCSDERGDALAAYTLALRWYVSRDDRYARKAIEIMDAWSAVLKDHSNSNAPLQTGWSGASWARAAEIIRYTYTGGWSGLNRFAGMLRTVYLPEIADGAPNKNGNWELIMMDAAIGIAVFLEDRAAFDKAVGIWRNRVPAYIYLTSDGSLPKTRPGSKYDTRDELIDYWQGQSTFVNGLSQETCRDFGHTGWGIAAAAHVAETAWHQGVDLYTEIKDRLRHALGFHADYQLGTAAPSWLCGGSVKLGLGPVTEVAFNHLHNRMGISMSKTETLTERQRPAGASYFLAWETLTHADNP
ncbi:alginate lyase family protein [Actinomadura vinacea]|uniref:Alginate lyase family protein n=2 Tax=Actinomadura vinacea TaxID=115336 RepID=A0ABP5VQ38_9ACTN